MITSATDVVEIIRIRIEEFEDGLFCATSQDVPGLVVIEPNIEALAAEIPKVIAALYQANEGRAMTVMQARGTTETTGGSPMREPAPWVAIPAHLAAAAMPA